ncbi:HAD family hydrolase [Pseudorhizobium halotolerans]|uniref:phosphoglycolate phosphatase n=1 Tax=Pseudorhizobium halotolerans TaxID=1233081 RepID=A0ABN7JXL3_9HYPH|nr:HAD hydrolase-like protein [Pseudorhizobium halotolerans]CAD7053220.1 HAD family hydrolase [Pseudorhizobium halotolerans]
MRFLVPFKQIIFDFDGVLLQSADLKTKAFAHAYEDEAPELINAVVAYQEAHGGIGRREKFRFFERSIFGRQASEERIDALCAQFKSFISDRILEVPEVAGARALLEYLHGNVKMHVVSGMPQDELDDICARRALTSFFENLIGVPVSKPEAFASILKSEGCSPLEVLAIGDSTTEFEAARDLCIPFLAVVPEGATNKFPPGTCSLRDFSGVKSTLHKMRTCATSSRMSS